MRLIFTEDEWNAVESIEVTGGIAFYTVLTSGIILFHMVKKKRKELK